MDIEDMVNLLYDKDDKKAYASLKELESISDIKNDVYRHFDEFINMLSNEKSYIRVRGFRLICKNAKWDKDNKINKSIDKILLELEDEKPTALKQCLNAIKNIIKYKKELKDKIKEKLLNINYLKYNDSMQSLIFKDIEELLNIINEN